MAAPKSLAPPPPNEKYISYGEVGHADETPSYAWIDSTERVYVEVTLRPSGDEVVARLDTGTCGEGGFYMGLHYGAKVVVAFPGGTGGEPVIIGRVNDRNWPFPESVCEVSSRGALGELPTFAFLKTAHGQLLAIETGADGDVLVHSGASVEVKASAGGQILLNGRTHLGHGPVTPPTGDTVGPAGEITPGTPATPHEPTPGTNVILLPGEALAPNGQPWPAEGIMRFKDGVQCNAVSDSVFWTWLNAVHLWITSAHNEPTMKAYLEGLMPPVLPPSTLPTSINSYGASCSQHTASDE